MKIEVKKSTPSKIKRLIADLLDIFSALGVPVNTSHRSLERMAKACLATGHITESFSEASSGMTGGYMRTRDIIEFENKYFGENISSGSYDDVRRKDLKLLIEAGIIIKSSESTNQATNDPSRGYALSEQFVHLLKQWGKNEFELFLQEYLSERTRLEDELKRQRTLSLIPVTLPNGKELSLSFGSHNNLQKRIIEDFLPRFGFGSEVLYVGDAEAKFLHIEKDILRDLNFYKLEHEELPDIIAYCREKNLLYLIEAFHSTGEWDEIRLKRIKNKLKISGCNANLVFFTAFETRADFRKRAKDIAWETEVWIADNPDHIVHFNGYKFLEIHNNKT